MEVTDDSVWSGDVLSEELSEIESSVIWEPEPKELVAASRALM